MESFFLFYCDCLFFFKSHCFVLRWRFHSPFNISLEMNTSGFAGNILCVHLDPGAGVIDFGYFGLQLNLARRYPNEM